MSASRLLAPAIGLVVGLGVLFLSGATNPVSALDIRVSSGLPVVASPLGVPLAVSVSGPARAQVVYVVHVAPRVLGVRDAPVGQPVVYVIDGPDTAPGAGEPHVRRVAP